MDMSQDEMDVSLYLLHPLPVLYLSPPSTEEQPCGETVLTSLGTMSPHQVTTDSASSVMLSGSSEDEYMNPAEEIQENQDMPLPTEEQPFTVLTLLTTMSPHQGTTDSASSVMLSGSSTDEYMIPADENQKIQDMPTQNYDMTDIYERLEDIDEIIKKDQGAGGRFEPAPPTCPVPAASPVIAEPSAPPPADVVGPRRSPRREAAATKIPVKMPAAKSKARGAREGLLDKVKKTPKTPSKKTPRRSAEQSVESGLYKCSSCDHRSKSQELLRRHMMKHKPPTKKCPECGKEFKYRQNLTRHMRTVHTLLPDGSKAPAEKSFTCDFGSGCEFKSHRQDKVNDHIHSTHPKEPMLTCGLNIYKTKIRPCVFVCFRPDTLLHHRTHQHPYQRNASE